MSAQTTGLAFSNVWLAVWGFFFGFLITRLTLAITGGAIGAAFLWAVMLCVASLYLWAHLRMVEPS